MGRYIRSPLVRLEPHERDVGQDGYAQTPSCKTHALLETTFIWVP